MLRISNTYNTEPFVVQQTPVEQGRRESLLASFWFSVNFLFCATCQSRGRISDTNVAYRKIVDIAAIIVKIVMIIIANYLSVYSRLWMWHFGYLVT